MIYGHGLDATYKDQHIDQWLRVKVLFGDETCLKRAAFDLEVVWSMLPQCDLVARPHNH